MEIDKQRIVDLFMLARATKATTLSISLFELGLDILGVPAETETDAALSDAGGTFRDVCLDRFVDLKPNHRPSMEQFVDLTVKYAMDFAKDL